MNLDKTAHTLDAIGFQVSRRADDLRTEANLLLLTGPGFSQADEAAIELKAAVAEYAMATDRLLRALRKADNIVTPAVA